MLRMGSRYPWRVPIEKSIDIKLLGIANCLNLEKFSVIVINSILTVRPSGNLAPNMTSVPHPLGTMPLVVSFTDDQDRHEVSEKPAKVEFPQRRSLGIS
jgi:hypothetical protein